MAGLKLKGLCPVDEDSDQRGHLDPVFVLKSADRLKCQRLITLKAGVSRYQRTFDFLSKKPSNGLSEPPPKEVHLTCISAKTLAAKAPLKTRKGCRTAFVVLRLIYFSRFLTLDGYRRYRPRTRAGGYARRMREPSGLFTGHTKTQHSDTTLGRFAKLKPGKVDSVGRYPRLEWGGLCPTLRAGTGSDKGSYQAVRPVHPKEDRVITPREAARLQGFPDRFIFHPTVWHSCRMIGNSVSPILAEELLKRVVVGSGLAESSNIAAE